MLNAAWEEKKKTNKPKTERLELMHPQHILHVFCRQIQHLHSFFLCLLFGQMLVENRVEAGVWYWECVFVFCVCVWEVNVLPAYENRTQSHEKSRCPLFGMLTQTQMYTQKKRKEKNTDARHLCHSPLLSLSFAQGCCPSCILL